VHITSDVDGRSNSGTARVCREIVNEISSRGQFRQFLVHFEESDDKIYRLPGVQNVLIKSGNHSYTKSRSLRFIRYWLKFRILHPLTYFDAVHWHSSRLFPLFFLIPSRRTIVTLYDSGNQILPQSQTLANRLFYWNARVFQSRIYKIIAVSHSARADLNTISKFDDKRLVVVPCGTKFSTIIEESPQFELPERYIICVSRWQPHKNVESFIEAINLMRIYLEQRSIQVILVGKPVGNHDKP